MNCVFPIYRPGTACLKIQFRLNAVGDAEWCHDVILFPSDRTLKASVPWYNSWKETLVELNTSKFYAGIPTSWCAVPLAFPYLHSSWLFFFCAATPLTLPPGSLWAVSPPPTALAVLFQGVGRSRRLGSTRLCAWECCALVYPHRKWVIALKLVIWRVI